MTIKEPIWINGPFPRVIKFQKGGSLQWHWAVVLHARDSSPVEYPSQQEAEAAAGVPFVDLVWSKEQMRWVYEGYAP